MVLGHHYQNIRNQHNSWKYIYIFFDNHDMKTSFFFIIDFCFKEMYF